jgi:outer membrane receptor protein involved in Fe transport
MIMKRIFGGLSVVICLLLIPALLRAQSGSVSVSGQLKDKLSKASMAYVNVLLQRSSDSAFVSGTVTAEDGRFVLAGVKPGNYLLQVRFTGYKTRWQPVFVGTLSEYLDLAVIEMEPDPRELNEVVVTSRAPDDVSGKLDKKVINVSGNLSQAGGSVLQVMQNLPGVTVDNGKVLIRGSDKVAVLVDGKQTALTGFGNQASLDNIPASAIDKIEIINNPSARYDANGNAGIINIIFKKNKKEGFSGKLGFATGLGAIWQKKENLPGVRPQFQGTPKVNPSVALNYRKNKINAFLQSDFYYNPTLNKNEFVTRTYSNGDVVQQQTKRNRRTTVVTGRTGFDWSISDKSLFTVSALYSSEKILDDGDEPFFNKDYSVRNRLWQFLEDELKTTVTASSAFQHKFAQPGHTLNVGLNYTFHREDEKYFFTNTMPAYTGYDSFKLLSDEHVTDLTIDYTRPLRYGKLEAGIKYRWRNIPTDMKFYPGLNSPLDVNAGGWAVYKEDIPAVYGTYIFENNRVEAEAGVRMEYVHVRYDVDPKHNTYKSDGYRYTQPFPNVRFAYKFNNRNKLSVFYNRRVDRPAELDIRVFPKYDDAEIIKVGNPALKPQFTNSIELGYKTSFSGGYVYTALYHRMATGTITRIGTVVPGSTIIYNGMQNAGKSYNTGLELVYAKDFSKVVSFNLNMNGYRNQINGFTVENKYPVPSMYTAGTEVVYSGNIKTNFLFHLKKQVDIQCTAVYLAPDLIPQGRIRQRFSLDLGIKKQVQQGKGELFVNATDLLNTMVIKRTITGNGFGYVSADYYETQVVRLGYSYKF